MPLRLGPALALFTAALLALPAAAGPGDWLEALVLDAAGGDPDALGTRTTWSRLGARTEPLDGHAFLALARAAAADGGEPIEAPVLGLGDATLAAALGQDDCATLEYHVFMVGAHDPEPPTIYGPSPFPLCGGEAALMTANSGYGSPFVGCGRATVWLSPVVEVPGRRTCYLSGFVAVGSGVLERAVYFDLVVDHFRGNEGEIRAS